MSDNTEKTSLTQIDVQKRSGADASTWSETINETYSNTSHVAYQKKSEQTSILPSAAVHDDGSIDFGIFGKEDGSKAEGPKTGKGENKTDRNDDGKGNPSDTTATTDTKADGIIDPAYRELAESQQLGVRSVPNDGCTQYEFYTTIDGVDRVFLQTDQPPEIAEKQLKQAQEEKLKQLENTYNVRFARDGETVESSHDQPKDVPVTTPTLGELSAMSEALLRSAPDTQNVDGTPLKIIIGDKDVDLNLLGEHRENEIIMSYKDDLSYLKEVTIHELAHVGQDKLYEKEGEDEYAEDLGWVKAGDDWLLRGAGDSYWKNTSQADGERIWIRTDSEGNPADGNGVRVENPADPESGDYNDNVQQIPTEILREIAVVKPYSTYFENPTEMGAALITPFRDGRELRAQLYEVSPESYQIAKKLDQQQIDNAFGVDQNGQSKMIRNPDGVLVENTQANQQDIEDYENGFPQ